MLAPRVAPHLKSGVDWALRGKTGWSILNQVSGESSESQEDEAASGDSTNSETKGPRVNEGQQGKHIPGHNNFQPGKSELTDSNPQELLDQGAGMGQQIGSRPVGQSGSKERVDFGRSIGNYVDPVSGEKTPTSVGVVHYGSRGAHIVPARPKP